MVRWSSILLLLAMLASEASASTMSDTIGEARRQYGAQEYERVIRLLTPVVQTPLATIGEKVDAFELLGLCYLILGDAERARDAFENLLSLDPGHLLRDPSESPKLKQFFERVKQAFVPGYQPHAPVGLEHAAPTRAVAGRVVEFGASIVRGATMVHQVLLRWRRSGLLTYRTTPMRGVPRLMARFLLPRDTTAYQLDYYIEARDAGGNTVARAGAPEQPLSLRVRGAPPPKRPFYRAWWFWTAVGVATVGVITVSAVALSADKAPTGNLSPGQLQLE